MSKYNEDVCKLAGIEPHIIEYKKSRKEIYPNLYDPQNFVQMAETKFFGEDMTILEYVEKVSPFPVRNRECFIKTLKLALENTTMPITALLAAALRRVQWKVF